MFENTFTGLIPTTIFAEGVGFPSAYVVYFFE